MTIRLPKWVLIGLGILLVAGAAVVAGVLVLGGGDDEPLDVPTQAQTSFDSLYNMGWSSADQQCYTSLDYATTDASCAAHWDGDSQAAATESTIWDKALRDQRVAEKYLDVAHAFKDTLLYASHVFGDLSVAVAYHDPTEYFHSLPQLDTLRQKVSDLQTKLRAAGLNPYISGGGTGGSPQ